MKKIGKRILSTILAVATIMSCWVWMAPEQSIANAANDAVKDHYLFAYFTGTSKNGQTIHLAVSEDGYNFTSLRNNEPILIPSKGVGNVRDPYIWYNEQDHYYYIIATDLDFTDGGGDYYNRWAMNEDTDYSDNSQSFLIWRSRDLINWYDETMIDVAAMSHLIGDTSRMTQVWAPQVLWDGTSYIVYFTLCCEQTKIDGSTRHDWTPAKDGEDNGRNMEIVYLRTSDLLDKDAYYDYGVLYDNPAKNTIDADIIYNEKNGKYYLFYKNEDGYDPGNVQQIYDKILTRDWKSVHYLVGDSPTGPFTKPASSHDDYGFRVFDGNSERLEGGNGFFDNKGRLVVYADAYDKGKAYFFVARSNNDDWTQWDYIDGSNSKNYGINTFNINDLSPRHGSVVKITKTEYDRLLASAYSIKSSSFPMGENLEDHLVGRFFTTTNALENAVEGKPNLDSANGVTMEKNSNTGEYCAKFSTTQYALIDLENLFTEDLNYDDGFTITFKAMANSRTDAGYNQKIFAISDDIISGDDYKGERTGTEHCIDFSTGNADGAYLYSYYGPGNKKANLGQDVHSWANDDKTNRADGKWHEYLISSANGNLLVYIDGKLAMSRNRFTTGQRPNKYSDEENFSDRVLQVPVRYTDEWYKAIGNSTMFIGKSCWNDPYFQGSITNFCIYDCSMSYYDIETITNTQENEAGITSNKPTAYSTFSTAIPSFTDSSTSEMSSLAGTCFNDVIYSPQIVGMPSGTDNGADPTGTDSAAAAAFANSINNSLFAIYYPENTVLFYDGVGNPARMPVELAGRINETKYQSSFKQVYPTVSQSDVSDNKYMSLTKKWVGWNSSSVYHTTIGGPDGSDYEIGHNKATTTNGAEIHYKANDSDRKVTYFANVLEVNEANLSFGTKGYQKIQLTWHMYMDKRTANWIGSWGSWSDISGDYFSDHNIWVIDLSSYVSLRSTIVNEYETYIKTQNVCPGSISAYKAVVESIVNFNPHNFTYSVNTEAAVKACSAEVQKLIQDYSDAKANLKPCNANIVISAVEDDCDKGIHCSYTQGATCSTCGKAQSVQEQHSLLTKKVADTAHRKTKATYTQKAEYYYSCSHCGDMADKNNALERKYYWADKTIPFELSYDNLFLFSEWAISDCSNCNADRGTMSIDGEAGTITMTTYNSTDFFTNYGSGSNYYSMKVDDTTEYTFEYTVSAGKEQVHIFFYDANGNAVLYPANRNNPFTQLYGGTTAGTRTITFTPPEGTVKIAVRFGSTVANTTTKFSNIALYVADRLPEAGMMEWNQRLYRETYYNGVTLTEESFERPTRVGYELGGLFIDDNRDGFITGEEEGFLLSNYEDWYTFGVTEQNNYIVHTKWNENVYNVVFHGNGATGSEATITKKFSEEFRLPAGSGFSKTGYSIAGWSTDSSASLPTYKSGSLVSKLAGHASSGDTINLYGIWSANIYNMTFDNLIDFQAWNKMAENGTVSNITDNGFTITSNAGVSESTSKCEPFPVTAGKQYKIDADITGSNWSVYIFFYDDTSTSGTGLEFNDSKNSYDSGRTGGENQIFTAPAGATRAVVRVSAIGGNNTVTFRNVRAYEYKLNEINYTGKLSNAFGTYDQAFPTTAPTPTRYGYNFMGWYKDTTNYYDRLGAIANTSWLINFTDTLKLVSKWQLNNDALNDDTFVVDFGSSVTLDPVANDTIFTNEAKNQNTGYAVKIGSEYSGTTVNFAPTSIIDSAKEINYYAKLNAGDTTELSSKLTVVPASNVLYEDTFISTSGTGETWTTEGAASSEVQSSPTEKDIYGFDNIYANQNNYSNGSIKKVIVDASNKTSDKLTFTFTGTGFELYGACGADTGVQVIAVRKGTELIKSAVVDTYYNDTYGTLYQTPVYNVSGLDYGTYTVEVTAAYLPSISGAVKNDSSTFSSMSANDNDLEAALADLGLDYILEADDVDVEWFDDNSVLNGGTGAYDPTSFSTQGLTKLVNYVDAVRVFQPITDDSSYIESEKNARYYNITDKLMSKSGFLAGGTGFVYVEKQEDGNNKFDISAVDYNKKGSKHEIYLENGNDQALTFKVDDAGGYNKVMLSLRSATGTPIDVKIGSDTFEVNSKTDMYYDITDYVDKATGTVTIQNATANSLLSVGYLKLTGGTVLQSMSDLSTTIDMIEAPIEGEITASGSITNVEYTPAADSHNSFNVTVNGRPTMIQFIEEDGGTRTYDRNNKNVVIKSYNADGVEVNSLDRTVAYEVWTINTNLTGPDVKVRAKYISDGAYKWENECYSFTYEILEPEYDAEIREITPAAASGKKGAVSVKVVTGPDAQAIRFVMPDGSTCTYYAAKAVQLENGDLEFTGNAWMNEDGLNSISVNVKVNGVWKDLGAFDYTVE